MSTRDPLFLAFLPCLFRRVIVILACTSLVCGQPASAPGLKLQTLTIPMQIEGFIRTSMTVPRGHYDVVIINHTGRRGLHFAFERMPGNTISGAAQSSVFTGQAHANTTHLSQVVRLDPGTYRLRVVEQPSWLISLNVQP